MYLQHFGLRQLPFETTANGSVYVDLPGHRDAMNTVLFGLRSGEGFVKVVGEVGTGKTALCRSLIRHADANVVPIDLPSPALDPFDLLLAIAEELGVPVLTNAGMHRLEKYVREVLTDITRGDGRAVVFVDEAQTMPSAALEQLRLLSNLETDGVRLVQVVLFGQPELDEKLAERSLRQLQQRIAFSARLEPLDREDCRTYVQRRLIHCGARARAIFAPTALEQIHRGSGGLPRLINILCHKSLLAAYAEGEFLVERRHVTRAIRDTEGLGRWRVHGLVGRATATRARAGWSRLASLWGPAR